MFEDKKLLINSVPDSVDNAVKNITDKPTQNIGTTLADIWYLVFGGISHAAEKRKLKYSYALQEFENELKEKISKIPADKLTEPDTQIIAPALEASKYCIENKETRNMFSNLISSNMHIDIKDYSHPIFNDIVKNLNILECKILYSIYNDCIIEIKSKGESEVLINLLLQLDIALNHLNSCGLTQFDTQKNTLTQEEKESLLNDIKSGKIDKITRFFGLKYPIQQLSTKSEKKGVLSIKIELKMLPMTPLGVAFKMVCIDGISNNR